MYFPAPAVFALGRLGSPKVANREVWGDNFGDILEAEPKSKNICLMLCLSICFIFCFFGSIFGVRNQAFLGSWDPRSGK